MNPLQTQFRLRLAQLSHVVPIKNTLFLAKYVILQRLLWQVESIRRTGGCRQAKGQSLIKAEFSISKKIKEKHNAYREAREERERASHLRNKMPFPLLYAKFDLFFPSTLFSDPLPDAEKRRFLSEKKVVDPLRYRKNGSHIYWPPHESHAALNANLLYKCEKGFCTLLRRTEKKDCGEVPNRSRRIFGWIDEAREIWKNNNTDNSNQPGKVSLHFVEFLGGIIFYQEKTFLSVL